MARMKLSVPAELVDALYHDLQMVWEDRTEAIMEIETGQLRPEVDTREALRRAKEQRHAVSELLDQVQWDERREDEAIELVGDRSFLDYMLRPLLYVLGDRINEGCQATVDQGASVEPILRPHQQLAALLDLLRHTDPPETNEGHSEDPSHPGKLAGPMLDETRR